MTTESSAFEQSDGPRSKDFRPKLPEAIELLEQADTLPDDKAKRSNKTPREIVFTNAYEETAPTESPNIPKYIKDLGDDEWTVRDQAYRNLVGLGREAIPFLVKGLDSDDAETKMRCGRALKEIFQKHPKAVETSVNDLEKLYLVAADALGWQDNPFEGHHQMSRLGQRGELSPEKRKELLEKAIAELDKKLPDPRVLEALSEVMRKNKSEGGDKAEKSEAVLDGLERLNEARVRLRVEYAALLLNGQPTPENKAKAIQFLVEALQINSMNGGTLQSRDLPLAHIVRLIDQANGFEDEALRKAIENSGGNIDDLRKLAKEQRIMAQMKWGVVGAMRMAQALVPKAKPKDDDGK